MQNRKFVHFASVCCAVLALVAMSAYTARAQDNPEVKQLVDLLGQHDDALGKKDLDSLMKLYADGNNTVVMGTGPGEKWQGKDQIRDAFSHIVNDFDAGSQTRDCYWKTGGVNGNTAWVSAMCKMGDARNKKKREFELNVSAVFEKIDDKWLFRSMHYSNLVRGK